MFCPQCGKEISDQAIFCDRCGSATGNYQPQPAHPMNVRPASKSPAPKKPIYTRWWFWAIIVVLFVSSLTDSSVSKKPTYSGSTEATDTQKTVTVSKQVVYEENGIRITATGIKNTYTGTDVTLLVENNTATNIAVGCSDFIVNGITVDGYLYVQVAAGKKANGELSLDADSLKNAGIEIISTIETFDAYISNTDTYLKTDRISLSINTSATGIVQTIDESGDVLFSQNGITVIAKNLSNGFLGRNITILVKNDSGQDIVVQADNVSVNGYTISVLHSDDIPKGSVRFCEIDLLETHLQDNNIKNIENVTFTLNILSFKTFQTLVKTNELELPISE